MQGHSSVCVTLEKVGHRNLDMSMKRRGLALLCTKASTKGDNTFLIHLHICTSIQEQLLSFRFLKISGSFFSIINKQF